MEIVKTHHNSKNVRGISLKSIFEEDHEIRTFYDFWLILHVFSGKNGLGKIHASNAKVLELQASY